MHQYVVPNKYTIYSCCILYANNYSAHLFLEIMDYVLNMTVYFCVLVLSRRKCSWDREPQMGWESLRVTEKHIAHWNKFLPGFCVD